jgi:ferritin
MTLDEIELYFETFDYPDKDIEILTGMIIKADDAEQYVTSTILTLRAHTGNKNYMPYWELLLKYYQKARW